MSVKQLDVTPQIVRRSQAIKRLGRQIFDDLMAAKWLSPCAVKPGIHRPNASVFFNLKDVLEVEKRILGGEYPVSKKATRK